MNHPTDIAPDFRLYLWSHRAVYVGNSPEHEPHKHHAAQLCISLDGELRARGNRAAPWLRAPAVLIPPDQSHVIDAGDDRIFALYWEPESIDYPFARFDRAVQRYPLADGAIETLREPLDPEISADTFWARCESALGLPRHRSAVRLDARVRQVLDVIRASPGAPHTLASLADGVHLSPGRLSHLFKGNIGVPPRRFIVWARSRIVVRYAAAGRSLTDAAHAAGFADAAHMSKTFRSMFGFAPSVLFAQHVPKAVILADGDVWA